MRFENKKGQNWKETTFCNFKKNLFSLQLFFFGLVFGFALHFKHDL
jgi:hypothetical protein